MPPPSPPPKPSALARFRTLWRQFWGTNTPPLDAPSGQPAPPQPEQATDGPLAFSSATTDRAYRKDAARHLYALNRARIFQGPLPPMLHAIGVLQVHVDNQGLIVLLNWLRAPSHAPEVVAEIERTVLAAEPFPRPLHLNSVVYTDTWLWDASGQFQLDTLTEGQL